MVSGKKKEFCIEAKDGILLSAESFVAKKPVASLIIVHGMAEHKERYEDFAAFLSAQKYSVYLFDLRGHGQTAGNLDACGFFSDKDGWKCVIDDLKQVLEWVKAENEGLPLFLLGHSMGSLVARCFISDFSDCIDGVILSGTPGSNRLMARFGLRVADYYLKKTGPRPKNPKLEKLMMGGYNTPFKPNRTEFDWLSSDDTQVDKYVADPYCGFVCSTSFYKDVLSMIDYSLTKEKLNQIHKNLPIFIVSGDKDPVGGMGKGVQALYRKYKKNKIEDVSIKLYENGRHEILNEIFKQEVYQDLLNWLMQHSEEGTGRINDR